ncbi:ABC transporter ATP-binding protein [Thermosipho melanesiensis]|uniref:ABC transporter related n=2 Tax=Thermosipho melanesiensis TaxID=46541 RepID=A6LM36_THEM4|nr:ABC transporter ATP-binding protein [Thermosipho melanesiensis]ABR30987.1 ABC transporter related [Thermosipho melanesiensis BI429]APT74084.1 multidrug ABC transporter ATP-binding protein [Thermosipho melanesiensis]
MITVKELEKSYKTKKAVDKVSFEVDKGEIFALLGPNGAGKTTTLKCILKLKKMDNGTITLNGTYTYLPEKKELYKSIKVKQMIEISEDISKYFSKQKALKYIEEFNLPLNEKVGNLSHGMATLLYLAIILSENVDIYFFDEPTWGLDPIMQKKVLELIRNLSLDGKTVFLTSHILSEVEKIADKVAIMSDGKIVEYDYLDNLKEKYVLCITQEKVNGYLYKKTENEKVFLCKKEHAKGKIIPATFEIIFEALVKEGKR